MKNSYLTKKRNTVLLALCITAFFSCSKNNPDKETGRAKWNVTVEQSGNYIAYERTFALSSTDMNFTIDYLENTYDAIVWGTLFSNFPDMKDWNIDIENPVSGLACEYIIQRKIDADLSDIPMNVKIAIYCNGELYAEASNTLPLDARSIALAFACNYNIKPSVMYVITDMNGAIRLEDIDGNPIEIK